MPFLSYLFTPSQRVFVQIKPFSENDFHLYEINMQTPFHTEGKGNLEVV